uniref:Uncharacterized protein n=1 Tax=Anguilla anguilla TaxID=7936 RepID=A0A0E9PSQ8_ANGAN
MFPFTKLLLLGSLLSYQAEHSASESKCINQCSN